MRKETVEQLGDWYQRFPKLWKSSGVNQIVKTISVEYQKYVIYPEPKQIFRAFELCQYNDIKGVILGMDPYSNGSATGLAFGVKSELYINPSLVKIREAIEKEIHNGLCLDFDYSLEYLANQGVLLLNSFLTVRRRSPGSHRTVWSDFTKGFLTQLSIVKPDLLWFLWGRDAQSFKQYIYPTPNIYEAEHPAYAARNSRPWITNNQFEKTKHIINW